MVRRAEIAQARVRLGCEVFGKRGGEPRLADAGLAGNQHYPSFAALRLVPAVDQQLDFLLAADGRCLSRAQRLKPAQHPALTNDPPCRLRLGEAGERLRPEIGEIEQPGRSAGVSLRR